MLILGDPDGLGEALAHRFERLGVDATTAPGGHDDEPTDALGRPDWTAVAIRTHDDAHAFVARAIADQVTAADDLGQAAAIAAPPIP